MSVISSITSLVTGAISGYSSYLIMAAVFVATTLGAYELGHYKGGEAQKALTAQSELKAQVKGETVHGQIEQKVIKLSDPDLDGELDKWMRD